MFVTQKNDVYKRGLSWAIHAGGEEGSDIHEVGRDERREESRRLGKIHKAERQVPCRVSEYIKELLEFCSTSSFHLKHDKLYHQQSFRAGIENVLTIECAKQYVEIISRWISTHSKPQRRGLH